CPDARCGAIPEGDRVATYVTQRGKTTYVTYTSNGLPLTNLIRDVVPFGDIIADLTEPMLTKIVNSAYPNGNPIPADPSKYQPATRSSSLTHLAAKAPDAPRQDRTPTDAEPAVRTTPTAETMAADTTPSDKKTTTARGHKPKPLTNVVRESEKAVPHAGVDQ